MTLDEAMGCLGLLVGVGHGWNDENVVTYAEAIRQWPDGEAACEACALLAEEWKRPVRVPLGVIRERYDEIHRMRLMNQPEPVIAIEGRQLTIQEAKDIAGRNYLAQCKVDGREPNWDYFERLFGAMT